MADLLPRLRQQFVDANGAPLSGGKLYTYVAGTTTPLATYVDSALITPNTNPIILDSAGYCDIWIGTGTFKFVLKSSLDVVQWTVDNVPATGSVTTASTWTSHAITDGQAAADLSGQTVNFALYSSAVYDVEIIRGTTVFSNIPDALVIQNVNGTCRLLVGMALANEEHGVTFTISQAALVAQLRAATSTGPGTGTIKLSRRLIPV